MVWRRILHFSLALSVVLALSSAALAQAPKLKPIKIGAVASGATSLPNLVISQEKLDEKYGLKVEWVKLDQASAQKAFALRQYEVNFAQVPLDLIRQRARGDKVVSFRAATLTNNYVVVKKDSPYKTVADLKGKKFGIYSWSTGTTAALNKILRDKYGLALKKDFDVIVGSPPALVGLLDNGEIPGSVHVDPIVIKLLSGGEYRQIMDLYEEWYGLTRSLLLVTTLAAWEDFAQKNPDLMRNFVKMYNEAIDYIVGNPQIYQISGFIKESRMPETPENIKLFDKRFTRLYTKQADWNQALIDANNKVFEEAIAMKTLERLPKDWYTFDYLPK